MSDTHPSETAGEVFTDADMQTALFAQLIMQQTDLAMMLLGKQPNPQTGELTCDLDSARLFIDQLEMLEVKTKGNLTPEEGHLLQQSLMTLRMAFVKAVEAPPGASAQPATAEPPAAAASGSASVEESPKRFTKKY